MLCPSTLHRGAELQCCPVFAGGGGGAVFNDTRLQHPGHGEQQKQLQFCFIAHVHACARMEEVKSSLPV